MMSLRCVFSVRSKLSLCCLGVLLASIFVRQANAEISFVDMFRTNTFVQNGDGNSLASGGSFLTLSLTSTNPGDYDSVESTYPGPGSPVALGATDPTTFTYQTPTLPTQAAMDAAFPTGTYEFAASNVGGTDTASFDYTADYYSQSLPYLAGSSYSSLQNMNPLVDQTVQFNPDASDPGSTSAFVFFTVRDNATSALVFNASFLSSTTTSETIPANTLAPNGSYTYELIFSDRLQVPSPGAVFDAQIGYDLRTTGTFATAPEPATWLSAAMGLLILAVRWRRHGSGFLKRRCREFS
ncbi:MAG: hypothetical protein ABUL64_02825 [Singulisphaera sp.]